MTNEYIKGFVDGAYARGQSLRRQTQMTLGEIIAALESIDPNSLVYGFGGAACYVWHPEDVAFVSSGKKERAADVAKYLRTYCGASLDDVVNDNGKSYIITEHTPVWIIPSGGGTGLRFVEFDDIANEFVFQMEDN